MRTSLTRALAGTAIAAAAALTAVGAAGAAGATTKAPTTLAISVARPAIAAGQEDHVTGTLLTGTKPVAKKVVWLDRVVSGKLFPVEVALTGPAGHVFFTVKPKATVTYELVFRGTANFAASHSARRTVTVIAPKAPTSLSIKDTKPVIKPGQTDTIIGTLATGLKPLPGKVVYLERLVKGKFVPVQADLTGKYGHVYFKVSPKVTAYYMLVFRGTPRLGASHSGVLKVTVS